MNRIQTIAYNLLLFELESYVKPGQLVTEDAGIRIGFLVLYKGTMFFHAIDKPPLKCTIKELIEEINKTACQFKNDILLYNQTN